MRKMYGLFSKTAIVQVAYSSIIMWVKFFVCSLSFVMIHARKKT